MCKVHAVDDVSKVCHLHVQESIGANALSSTEAFSHTMPWSVFRAALVEAAMEEMSEAHADCCLEVQRMLQLHNDYLANADAPDICYLCREEGIQGGMCLKNKRD